MTVMAKSASAMKPARVMIRRILFTHRFQKGNNGLSFDRATEAECHIGARNDAFRICQPFVDDRFIPDDGGFLHGVGIGETGDRCGLASYDSCKARSLLVVVERMTAGAALFEGGAAGDTIGFRLTGRERR